MPTIAPDSSLVSRFIASPNFDAREGSPVDVVVLHYTGMPEEGAALARLCDPEAKVSSHYVVRESGEIVQLVAEEQRAWHAGVSSWQGQGDINSRSVGIEIANRGHDHGYPDFPDIQVDAVIALACDICARNGIRPERILAHSDIAPDRKRDPGEKFPWARLAAAGVGHFVEPEPIRGGRFFSVGESGAPIEALQAMLALYGYPLQITGVYDTATEQVVTAFQRHFRPSRVDGIADSSTIATLHRLARGLTKPGADAATAGSD